MNKTQEALKLALEALEESLGYVEEEAENAQRLYGQYPTRQARIQGLKDDARKHMDAITAIREALAEQPAQQQEPVAWMHNSIEGNVIAHRPADINRYPERWTALYAEPKPCPTCEALARTVMMDQTAHDIPSTSKPWVGLTDEEVIIMSRYDLEYAALIGEVQRKLKEKNA